MKRNFTIWSLILGVFSFLLLSTAYASNGGPDTFGYIYSTSSGTTAINHTGAAITVGGRADDTLYGSFNLGFTFNFYGTDYTTFYICNNGFVTFVSGNCGYNEADIPTAGAPAAFIAPYWDDLYTGGTIKYELLGAAPNQYMVISFENINHINYQASGATFQIVLYETTNNIRIQYGDSTMGNAAVDYALSATVGIEDLAGTDGLKFSYHAASLSDGLAINYTAPTPTLSVAQSAYRLFSNSNSTDVSTALAAQDTSVTLGATNDQFRLRILLHIAGTALTQSTGSFKLQYVGKGSGTCSAPSAGTPSAWTDVTTITDIAFYNNSTPTDGDALTSNGSDPTHSTDTIVNQTYEEANNFSNSQSLIGVGQDGKWDFSLYDRAGSSNITYCLRVVTSSDVVLDNYVVYPEITTKTAAATSGGPDTYGYRWNSNYGTGEAYSWNDISATGTEITGRSDDGMSGVQSIGFTFSFYGNAKTQFYVCNNGFISFSGDACAYINATITTAGTPNDFIAPFWDDQFTAGHIYYETIGSAPSRQLIVSFDGINPYSNQANAISYQIILNETTGVIKLQYKDVDFGVATYGGGLGATVGIENSTGSDGLLYSFDQASLVDNYAITFSSSVPYAQSAYRFFSNNNSSSVWSAFAAQDTPYTLTSDGEEFRIRMLIHNAGSSLSISGGSFKLQFADKGVGTCSSPTGSWTDITTSTSLAYKDNPTPVDGDALNSYFNDPTHGGDTINNQTYEEANNFTNSQSAIASGEDGKWDFSLYDKSVSGVSTFCIRAVTSTDGTFSTYTSYPQITTAAGASSLTFSLTNTNIDLGTITSTASTAATATTISVTTNATNGFEVYLVGEGNGATAGLYSSAAGSLISASASSSIVSSGAAGFGIYAENSSVGITIDEGFDNDAVADLAISRSPQKVFSTTSSTGGAQTADLKYKAVIDSGIPAGSFVETIDVIVFGSF